MSYKRKLEILETKYGENLNKAKMFALEAYADREARSEKVPNIKGLISDWSTDEIEAAKDFYKEAKKIFDNHYLIKTIVMFAVGVGAVIIIKKIIGIAFYTGVAVGENTVLEAICNAADEAKAKGEDSFDLMQYKCVDETDWTQLTVHISPVEAVSEVTEEVTQATE